MPFIILKDTHWLFEFVFISMAKQVLLYLNAQLLLLVRLIIPSISFLEKCISCPLSILTIGYFPLPDLN